MPSTDWTWTHARHLLNRAGFGGRRDEITSLYRLGLDGAVDSLLRPTDRRLPQPDWLAEDKTDRRKLSKEEQKENQKLNRQRQQTLIGEWIISMIETPTPADMLRARMTFFWHGHFATSIQKVKTPHPIFAQLELFDAMAVGSYSKLLHAIVRDPAMLIYLDNTRNHRGKPNENLARELMELFSLGPGNYSESDIREGARALTGWGAGPQGFRLAARRHDSGEKTILGQTGKFDADGFVEIILQQPACAAFMIRKLWQYFAGTDPAPAVLGALAAGFRASDYDVRLAVRDILRHPKFYSEAVRGNQIKSPLQLVVGTARTLQAQVNTPKIYQRMLTLMGQAPYQPPNVKGWPSGRAWIDTTRLVTRYTFAEMIANGEIPGDVDPRRRGRRRGVQFDPYPLVNDLVAPEEIIAELTNQLLTVPPTDGEHRLLTKNLQQDLAQLAAPAAVQQAVGNLMRLPQYQLC
ncbi:MAG: DUF1800 domain-containing protein [Lentisphaeria bacterium]|jgi:uncharacterized protein (DUF1800 family)|nr:DUF1800 domain-containing protein [Lentisphaeria bacterium]MDP7742980.1 DUF1800 domain-containing protein [Lentisphaeria bacterium]